MTDRRTVCPEKRVKNIAQGIAVVKHIFFLVVTSYKIASFQDFKPIGSYVLKIHLIFCDICGNSKNILQQ